VRRSQERYSDIGTGSAKLQIIAGSKGQTP
jgi:hypothetical protein